MNAKVELQISRMKQQTIGVEVEMNNIKRSTAAKVACQYFTDTLGTPASWQYEGTAYDTYTATDSKGRKWKFMRDSSIHGDNAEKCELVTPILKYEDIETLQGLIRALRKAGAKSDYTRGCGVHIHIGADGQTPQSIRNLTNIVASHEDLLIDALGISPARIESYCKKTNATFIAAVNKNKPTTMGALSDIWYDSHPYCGSRHEHYNSSRYHILNLHATFTKGTIEFRIFQFDPPKGDRKNGLHAGQLKAYIQLCLAMTQMAKDNKTASPKPLATDNPKYAMRTWLLRLGLIGDEFKTARELLTERLAGDAAFRHGRVA